MKKKEDENEDEEGEEDEEKGDIGRDDTGEQTLMEMKLAWPSQAMALANSVLPQPGGPYSSTPGGTFKPKASKVSGLLMGSRIDNSKSARI